MSAFASAQNGDSSNHMEKPRARLLVPLWGTDYVRRFASVALPSLLAPGNLPALDAVTDLEVLLLMPDGDFRQLSGLPVSERLLTTIRCRHIPIDDLLVDRGIGTPFYGITLTHAYWRGIKSAGPGMVDTRFIFMNADFVVADGSLRTLATRILAGHRVVLASNLRCIAEDVEKPLTAHRTPDGTVLAIPPRAMVTLALRHQHPLQVAKTVNAELCHSVHPNQFFWQVDDHTMISRHYLFFMLYLHPERVVEDIQGFCDYAFVPELCPTAQTVAMEDSDEFCMFEMQSRQAELEFLRPGRPVIEEVAASLSSWTTSQQRDSALRHPVVFHAVDRTPHTERLCAEAQAFIEDLDRRLAPSPQDHREHPYWIHSTTACGLRDPAPVPPPPVQPKGWLPALHRRLYGTAPNVAPWHPNWLDFRPVAELLKAHGGPGGRDTLYVHEGSGRFAASLPEARLFRTSDALSGRMGRSNPPCGDRSLVLVEIGRDYTVLRGLSDALKPYLRSGGRIVFFHFEPRHWESGVTLAYDMRRMIGYIDTRSLQRCELVFAGGRAKRRNAILFDWMTRQSRRWGWGAAIGLAPARLALIFATAWSNRAAAGIQDSRRPVRDCSSFALVVVL